MQNQELFNNIQELQNYEKDYFKKLEEGIANDTITDETRQMYIDKINELSNLRINLYKLISKNYSMAESTAEMVEQTVHHDKYVTSILESELNTLKNKFKEFQTDHYNKLRLIEINDYYSEQYMDRTNIVKNIILFCLLFTALTLLYNNGLLLRSIYLLLIIIFSVIALLYIAREILISYSRDNMSYQEYSWGFNKAAAPKNDTDLYGQPHVNPWKYIDACSK
jgi:hypothetical protein